MKIKNLPKLLSIIVTAASTYLVAGEQEDVRGHSGSHHFEGKVGGGRDAYDMHDINGAKGNAFVQGNGNQTKSNYKTKKDQSWKDHSWKDQSWKDQSTHVTTNVKARLF